MRLGLIIILLFSVLWAYEWVPVYGGNHQIHDVLYFNSDLSGSVMGCENGLLIADGDEWIQVETALPVWKVLPYDEENLIFIQGNGSYSDGVYLFNKLSYEISVLEWIVYPHFLVYDEESDLFFLGASSGLYVSSGGQFWIPNSYFNGFNCKDMIIQENDYVVTASGANGGVFYSNNGGATWHSSLTGNIPFSDLSLDTNGLLYGVLSGETNSSGLWKSNDLGVNWQFMINEDNCTKVGVSTLNHPFLGSDNGIFLIDSGNSTSINVDLPDLHINGFINDPEILSPNLVAFTNNGIHMVLNFFNNRTLYVPQQYPTIQSAVNAACTNETIMLADGTFTGEGNKQISWDGSLKHLTIRSLNGAENCIIDCEGSGSAFNFVATNQNLLDEIRGLTITNGYSDFGLGGALQIENCSLTIKNNTIINNFASGGGAIYCNQSNSQIISNNISHNEVLIGGMPFTGFGGGIAVIGGSPEIRDNEITNNMAGASDMESGAAGAGIYINNSNVEVVNNLILENSFENNSGSFQMGGAIYANNQDNGVASIYNNTILDNSDLGSEGVVIQKGVSFKNNISNDVIQVNSPLALVEVSNNNCYGNEINYSGVLPGLGDTDWGFNLNGTACDEYYNISEDPQFASTLDQDYFLSHLAAGQTVQSPCVDAGSGQSSDYSLYPYYTRTDMILDSLEIDMGFHRPGGLSTGVADSEIPSLRTKLTNYPNPFNPTTEIRFTAKHAEGAKIEIYNLKGQKIFTLSGVEVRQSGDSQSVTWNGNDSHNNPVSSGIYFAILKSEGRVLASRKMMLLK